MVAAMGWPKSSFARSYKNLEHTFWPTQSKGKEVQQLRWAPVGIQPVCSPSEWRWNAVRGREESTAGSFRTGTHEDINEMERRNQKAEKFESMGKEDYQWRRRIGEELGRPWMTQPQRVTRWGSHTWWGHSRAHTYAFSQAVLCWVLVKQQQRRPISMVTSGKLDMIGTQQNIPGSLPIMAPELLPQPHTLFPLPRLCTLSFILLGCYFHLTWRILAHLFKPQVKCNLTGRTSPILALLVPIVVGNILSLESLFLWGLIICLYICAYTQLWALQGHSYFCPSFLRFIGSPTRPAI